MFVYVINSMFGQAVVESVKRLPNGVVSVGSTADTTKAMHYEDVERLLTASERKARNLELAWLEI